LVVRHSDYFLPKQKEVGATLEGLPKPVWKDNEEQA
jgi:hypothetical protein